jgi:hypothetical protein
VRTVGIDAAIDALAHALTANGVEGPRPPAEPYDLDAIDAELAPMSLPAQVRRFWERVDPASLRVWPYPEPIPPSNALEAWMGRRDEFPGLAPLALFDVGYASHQCMSVELDSPFGCGGTLFEWNLVDVPFYVRYNDLAGWLDRITELLIGEQFDRREGPNGAVLVLTDPDAATPMTELPGPTSPNPVHGQITRYERDPLQWPLRWQRLSGIEPEDLKPRGATHTVAELLASDPARPLEATIAARVIDLGGSSDITRVRVSDGTGVMAINCPTAVTALGPSMSQEFEFDLIVPAGKRHVPPDPETLEELDDPVKNISQRLMARYGGPATAVAMAIRPLRGR